MKTKELKITDIINLLQSKIIDIEEARAMLCVVYKDLNISVVKKVEEKQNKKECPKCGSSFGECPHTLRSAIREKEMATLKDSKFSVIIVISPKEDSRNAT